MSYLESLGQLHQHNNVYAPQTFFILQVLFNIPPIKCFQFHHLYNNYKPKYNSVVLLLLFIYGCLYMENCNYIRDIVTSQDLVIIRLFEDYFSIFSLYVYTRKINIDIFIPLLPIQFSLCFPKMRTFFSRIFTFTFFLV